MEEFAPVYDTVAEEREVPYTKSSIEVAAQRIIDSIESDEDMIYGCREGVEGRPERITVRADGDNYYEDMTDIFQKEFLWE